MIQEIEKFSVISNTDDGSFSVLTFGEKNLEISVIGSFIEKQYELDCFYLIFTSFCDVYDEELTIYLLSKEFEIIDFVQVREQILISGQGLLEQVKIVSENTISFEFIVKKPWILRVLNKAQRIQSFLPLCAARPIKNLFSKKYLKLSH
tara:strand:+ start:493 stop:939 length:447 start_codon:yes stop_codon:yes gene_type:complete